MKVQEVLKVHNFGVLDSAPCRVCLLAICLFLICVTMLSIVLQCIMLQIIFLRLFSQHEVYIILKMLADICVMDGYRMLKNQE